MSRTSGWWSACAAVAWIGCSAAGDTPAGADRSGGPRPAMVGSSGAGGAGGTGEVSFGDGPSGVPTDFGPLPDAGSVGPGPGSSSGSGPISIDDCGAQNPAGLSAADAQKLVAGSGGAGSLRMLYPYDGTVFPRGLLSPLLMWDGVTGDYVYVHIKTREFEYKGCLTPTAPGQLQLPQAVWDAAGEKTYGGTDPATVELSVMTSGTVTGPATFQWTIAQATIKGSIFYNSYSSKLPGGLGGSVLRIPPGGQAEKFVAIDCNGCHSVSANGERLLTQALALGGRSYVLTPTTAPNPPEMATAPRSSYGALSPDGSLFLSTSIAVEVARSSLAQSIGAPIESQLFETDTGTPITGSGIPTTALMPMFSPDGKHLAFNDYAINTAHGLGIMDFDVATRSATNYRVLYTESDTAKRPGWPFFLPDSGGVVFTRTDGADFSGDGAGLIPLPVGPWSDLSMVDVDTGANAVMARAMGFATPADAANDGATYLPFGAEDLHKNYFPTVSPVAAGGYFWVFFDSLRHYGNLGLQRQLWGAAVTIDPDGDYTVDRSHPPYYLPGQEFGTGNHRAFAALDPCKQDGDDCTSGIDCCGGFCYTPDPPEGDIPVELAGTCTADVPECSKTNERCDSDADCCPPAADELRNSCIAGFCAYVVPVL